MTKTQIFQQELTHKNHVNAKAEENFQKWLDLAPARRLALKKSLRLAIAEIEDCAWRALCGHLTWRQNQIVDKLFEKKFGRTIIEVDCREIGEKLKKLVAFL